MMVRFGVALGLMCISLEAQNWKRIVTDVNPPGTPAAARTADGTLHVVVSTLDKENMYFHARLGRDGVAVGDPLAVVNDFAAAVENAGLVASGNRLELWFAGAHKDSSTEAADLVGRLRREIYENGAWRRDAAAYSEDKTLGQAGTVSAAAGKDGLTWVSTVVVSGPVQRNDITPVPLNPAITGCCFWAPGVAVDSATGDVVQTWFSLAADAPGTLARVIGPVAGPWRVAPRAIDGEGRSIGTELRSPVTARLGAPGVYLTYINPASTRVVVWRVGTEEPLEVPGSEGGTEPSLAAAPDGRLWVFWFDPDGIMAVRSNKAVTSFGQRTRVPFAEELENWTRHSGEASLGPLDLLVNNGFGVYHRRILALLTASANPARISSQAGGAVTVTVEDVGDPVEGAEVELLGQRVATDANGRAVFRLNPGVAVGNPEIVVRREGYEAARLNLRID